MGKKIINPSAFGYQVCIRWVPTDTVIMSGKLLDDLGGMSCLFPFGPDVCVHQRLCY